MLPSVQHNFIVEDVAVAIFYLLNIPSSMPPLLLVALVAFRDVLLDNSIKNNINNVHTLVTVIRSFAVCRCI